jgi:hypothetical protein
MLLLVCCSRALSPVHVGGARGARGFRVVGLVGRRCQERFGVVAKHECMANSDTNDETSEDDDPAQLRRSFISCSR